MIKIGLLGVGHFGKFHLSALQEIPEFELTGFYDIDPVVSGVVAKQYGVRAFGSYEEMLENVDAVNIVTPTPTHFDCAVSAIRRSKHVFVEKPVTIYLEEAETLIKLSAEANVKVQVGHVERFNSAFRAVQTLIVNPMFIEVHRLAQFNPRSLDVSVILNLMIHDIDIVLSTVRSNIKKISASGVAVITGSSDIANARLEFDNGCIANITSSRISLNNLRKCRFFQKDAYISIDFLSKKSQLIRLSDAGKDTDPLSFVLDAGDGSPKKQIAIESPDIPQTNSIKEELISFYHSIVNNTIPEVTIEDGYNALVVAHKIMDIIKQSTGTA